MGPDSSGREARARLRPWAAGMGLSRGWWAPGSTKKEPARDDRSCKGSGLSTRKVGGLMRSVLTTAIGVALVSTCFVTTGCANRRAVSRSIRQAPVSNVRLARRSVRAPRVVRTARVAPRWIEVPSSTARSVPPEQFHTVSYAPSTAVVSSQTLSSETLSSETLSPEILDPCGIAGNEHLWVDVTGRDRTAYASPSILPVAAPADPWMPAAYSMPVSAPASPMLPSSALGPSTCLDGCCALPGAAPGTCLDGQCSLPK